MKPMIKKILITIAFIISIGLSFWCGTKYGVNLGWKLYKPTLGMEAYSQALTTQISLEKIDIGKINEGRNNLMVSLSGNIVVLDHLLNNNDKNPDIFENILKRIAKHRDKNPDIYNYNAIENEDEKLVITKTAEILDKYKN